MKSRPRRELPEPHTSTVGRFVEPFDFRPAARAQLERDLEGEAIERLREWCEVARDMYTTPHGPSAGELRSALAAMADDAHALAGRLARSDATVGACLDLAGVKVARDFRWHERLAADLQALARELDRQAAALPDQSRRAAPVGALRPIADVCEASGVKLSASPSSRFLRIARTCFLAIGLSSPDHAARQLVDERKSKAGR